VRVTIWAGDGLADAARHHASWIKGEVLAEAWEVAAGEPPSAGVAQLDVDGSPASVRLEKVDPSD
jgi:hypothetical protein